ncbi:hypothetical protein NC652_031369 [Populus alba x Populus x berolinensis]|nr:hypothetical protein NC652_031369 [Populus alba x Populus x berolinensis]
MDEDHPFANTQAFCQMTVCHLKIVKIADPVGTTVITILSPFLPFAPKPRRSGFLSLMMR